LTVFLEIFPFRHIYTQRTGASYYEFKLLPDFCP
jgi:hypothetical protein